MNIPGTGNLYIRSLLYGNRRASYDSCEGRHCKYRNCDHNVYHTLSDDGNNCDSQQDIRESEKYITASHNQGIDNSAVETCDQSENNTDSRTNNRRCQRARRESLVPTIRREKTSCPYSLVPQMWAALGPCIIAV